MGKSKKINNYNIKNTNVYINGCIPDPTGDVVKFWLNEWDKNKIIPYELYDAMKYKAQELAVEKAFIAFKSLDDLESVLILCACLDKFYSTNVKYLYDLCSIILVKNDKILSRIDKGDVDVVIDIANYLFESRHIRYYSFASKFCFHLYNARHPELENPFYIYDSNVVEMLWYFRKFCGGGFFKRTLTRTDKRDDRDYRVFCKVYDSFKQYLIQVCSDVLISTRVCDKYLWLAGKVYFGYERKDDKNT